MPYHAIDEAASRGSRCHGSRLPGRRGDDRKTPPTQTITKFCDATPAYLSRWTALEPHAPVSFFVLFPPSRFSSTNAYMVSRSCYSSLSPCSVTMV